MTRDSESTTIPTLFVNRFTVLDFARLSPAGFSGESVYVNAEVDGALDSKGFLVDFGPVKKILKRVVDDFLDHRFAVPAEHGVERGEARVRVQVDQILLYEAPPQAFAFIAGGVDDGCVCAYLEKKAMQSMPNNVTSVRFTLEHEPTLELRPSYRYTHGLKLHDGNCQRLIHGHRNIVEVFVDGVRHEEGERALATHLENAHFAHEDDVKPVDPGRVRIAFNATQGEFWAEVPANRVRTLNCEPTVENIAIFARNWVSSRFGVDLERVAVRAYEGLHKGAQAGFR